tara:strand:- start:223 stop:1026 length:804 start_codon:yes stop_codon:yes gene_type:complete
MKKFINPIVKEVLDTYDTVQTMTEMFAANPDSVNRGLLVSGDAGMGKTHFVQKAFKNLGVEDRVMYVKGSSITAAAMYCLLYQSREKGQIIVFDDTDIIHKSSGERAAILDMFKAATEPTSSERIIGWHRAQSNPLMNENDVPRQYDFQGAIVWITNDSIPDMRKVLKGHWNAIGSRFNQIEAWFEDHEKIAYTLYLIEEIDMLGKNCTVKEGGFDLEVIEDTVEYMNINYKYLRDITPRVAIKIADIRQTFPDKFKVFCDNQFIQA